jgi:hypothetical protein
MSYPEISNLHHNTACLPAGQNRCLSLVSVVYCIGRGLCVGLITRPEEFYREWCVQWVWSPSPIRKNHDTESGRRTTGQNEIGYLYLTASYKLQQSSCQTHWKLLLLLLLLLLLSLTAIGFTPGGSSTAKIYTQQYKEYRERKHRIESCHVSLNKTTFHKKQTDVMLHFCL